MSLNYIGMLVGLIIALVNIFDPQFEGFMRWVIVSGGLLASILHLKIVLTKNRNKVVKQN
ncbi:hypothetical protein Q9R38_14495 [Priestia aryabhattai]|uniref:hypothetical protein n=1 Tax=Priestia aryabhattai TaxID=412384 RepID=UPI00064ECA8A|nr:hypothetical protein [Priestia aryabhattai]KML31419.1 hypothetical protein VL11_02375 [Priestia aryabhattai]KMN93137.1 hypothetical protein ABV89_26235 [Priestia aryabhattai]MDT0147724.1 hypothetical protein [Priestia aryabhattai]MDT0154409.1 hypothetical protein [Priestia aryabhattai]MED4000288.1 hypothetical protein [Priestia aryabhattai]